MLGKIPGRVDVDVKRGKERNGNYWPEISAPTQLSAAAVLDQPKGLTRRSKAIGRDRRSTKEVTRLTF